MRTLIVAVGLSGLLVLEDALAALQVAGWFAPDCALLLILMAALRSSGEVPWLLCAAAGLIEGGRSQDPGGLYILMYTLIAFAVTHARGLLYLESRGTQALVAFAAGCVYHAGRIAYHAAAEPGTDPPLMRALCAAAVTACAAPLAMALARRSRFIRALIEP